MDWEDEAQAESSEEAPLPGTSTQDRLTYDPTQGEGTPAWQLSVRAQMERNAQERRN